MTPEVFQYKISELILTGAKPSKILEFIQQAKEEWEKASYGKGWIGGIKSIKKSRLNN